MADPDRNQNDKEMSEPDLEEYLRFDLFEESDQEQNQQHEQEPEPETETTKRGRVRGRGQGRDTENATIGVEENEAAAPGGGRGRGRRGRGGGGGGGKGDFAIRETEAGSNEWRAKCYLAHKDTGCVFLNKTAAAVAFDISHIIALQRGFCKSSGRKGGCYIENASKQLLQDLLDVKAIKSYQKNGRDDLHSAVLVISKMVDAFLTGIRSKEDAEEAVFFSQLDPMDTHIIQLCFYRDKLVSQRHMRDVPGLEEIVEKHLQVLVEGLPDNPTAGVPAVVGVYSDDDEQNGGAAGLLPQPEDVPDVHPSGRPRRSATTKLQKNADGESPAKKVTPEKRKAAEDIKGKRSSSKKQRKKKGKGGDGGGGGNGGSDEWPAVEDGPYLVLEVCTECPSHGKSKTTHYHFAHDCVCEAKKQIRECFDFMNLDPSFRAYLNDFQLPPCFQEWKHRLVNANAGGVGLNSGGLNADAAG